MRRLQSVFPRITLVTIYKAFVRPYLDYRDISYDQPINNSFHDRLEYIQYNAFLAIMGAIMGTSREKLYQELALESFRLRCWYRKPCLVHKVFKNGHPHYLLHLIPVRHSSHASKNIHSIAIFSLKHNFFKNSFFPSTISEWEKLDPAIRNSESLSILRKNILHFIRPAPNSIYNFHNPKGVKLITQIRFGLSHLSYIS